MDAPAFELMNAARSAATCRRCSRRYVAKSMCVAHRELVGRARPLIVCVRQPLELLVGRVDVRKAVRPAGVPEALQALERGVDVR